MERLAMSKILEILRLRWVQALSVRQTALALGTSTGTVSNTTVRAEARELTWEEAERLSERELEERLYGVPVAPAAMRPEPDPVWMHTELKRKGVTLELLHLEYQQEHEGRNAYEYTAFCDRYRKWRKARGLSMRQNHRAGEKVFLDYSGKRPRVVDPKTGEVREVELFVAVLGASNYTYVEATESQRLADWIGSNVRTFEYFGGCPAIGVPDQLKAAVTISRRHEPTINRTYAELGRHYSMAIVPARPRKPKDKAKVEVGVQIAQRWILARLRNETFFSLADLNARIRELLVDLNSRPMKRYGGLCRGDLFESLDAPALHSLPAERFVFAAWSKAKVHGDYHVEVEQHYYSVPSTLVGEQVEVRVSGSTVEVLFKGQRVASHPRSYERYKHTTASAHMPPNHREYADTDPSALRAWAAEVGPNTDALMTRILERDPNLVQGFRSAQGLRRVGKKYGAERMEKACWIALRSASHSYKPVERILRLGREDDPHLLGDDDAPEVSIEHDQVRGPEHFEDKDNNEREEEPCSTNPR